MNLSNEYTDKLILNLSVVYIKNSKDDYEFSYNGYKYDNEFRKYLNQLIKNVEKEIRHNLLNFPDVTAKEYYLKTLWNRSNEAVKKAKYINEWFTYEDEEDAALILELRPDTFELEVDYAEDTLDGFDLNSGDFKDFIGMYVYHWRECSLIQLGVAKDLAFFVYKQDVNKCLERTEAEKNETFDVPEISSPRAKLLLLYELGLLQFLDTQYREELKNKQDLARLIALVSGITGRAQVLTLSKEIDNILFGTQTGKNGTSFTKNALQTVISKLAEVGVTKIKNLPTKNL